ncbi:MAG: hypothetical protein MJZ64_02120 [Paludibacteraceae bacterium]|nr:hypothetical protein [Paludibacteraceae bacterium]
MNKWLNILFLSIVSYPMWAIDAQMYAWHSHLAYGEVRQVVDAGDVIYGLAGKALFAVDKASEERRTFSKQDGLNGADIAQIGYDELSRTLIIAYSDGLIDMIKDGAIIPMTDLQQKDMAYSKEANKLLVVDGNAYMAMPFGVMVVDIKNRLIKDTYYIGDKSSAVNVLDVALSADSIFAISSDSLYSASKNANLLNYGEWNRVGKISASKAYTSIAVWRNELFAVAENMFVHRNNGSWISEHPDWQFVGIKTNQDKLFVLAAGTDIYYLDDSFSIRAIPVSYAVRDICQDGNIYWLATPEDGIVRFLISEGTQSFKINGPAENYPYRMRIVNGNLIMVPGGYYVSSTSHYGTISIYNNDSWMCWSTAELNKVTQNDIINLSDCIIDPKDANHFFVGSLGRGLIEFRNNQFYKYYLGNNSFLDSIDSPAFAYTWVDAFAYDSDDNLWMLNISHKRNIKILKRDGSWVALDYQAANEMERARDLLIWNQNENIKIISCNHKKIGICMLDDNGTLSQPDDDKCVLVTTFVDQDNNSIILDGIYSIAQTKEGALWIGTGAGIVVIDNPSELFTGNACRKIKIPRNDGTNLADYLLNTEQINAIAVDGANRKWIGTAGSGLYLISEDGQETIEHFTADNSPLLSDEIISLAIEPISGKVFIGTSKGLMSYQSDAASPFEDYSSVYAYPNPVRPDYEGVITITGLMDETEVHIVDNAGNLVCQTHSYGGTAVWDGKTADGHRVASGVYSVLCNEATDNKHAVVKILLMH